MFKYLLLALAAWTSLIHAIPLSRDPADVANILTRRAAVDSCPGYTASNVVTTDSSLTADLTLAGAACNAYSDDIKDLKLLVEYQTDERLHVKIYDADLEVFQVQEEAFPRPKNDKANGGKTALIFGIKQNPFSFAVKRRDNGEVLFDTDTVPLVFEKQYVRLRTKLPANPNIYGLGEHSDSFRFHTDDYERVLLNAESPNIPENANLYGTHPIYFDHRGDKGTHGVFMLNSSPMQVDTKKAQDGSQYLEYNTIGGIIDLYFMAGSKPADVSKQYADIAGYSAMYPYWTFGFHQCKYGYWDVNMVAEVVGNYSTAGIPLEVMWTDIDYMHLREDFTTDPDRFPLSKMRELVSTLHSRDQRYILILDPGIHAVGNYAPYQKGHEKDVFLKAADGSDILGVQWPGEVAWPDWFAPQTQDWWTDQFQSTFSPESGIDLDGIWVDMNEASNFCSDQFCNPRKQSIDDNIPPKPSNAPRPNTGRPIPGFPASFQPGSSLTAERVTSGAGSIKSRFFKSSARASIGEDVKVVSDIDSKSVSTRQSAGGDMKGFPDREWFAPAYQPHSHLGNVSQQTIYFNTTNIDGTWQYDTHNLHGHMMAGMTRNSMLSRRPELRPFVLTRSTFSGTGKKVAHWFGDNFSSWEHYRTSIRQMLAFVSMHQMPMVGSDVCGFNGNADMYMCARWAMLGAFQPFYRNHAELSTIHQEFYQWPIVAEAAKKAIDTRYKLMDYIYTALYYQTTEGTPMINPLFFLYPTDTNTFGIQEQWFYGDSLLISPVTTDYSDTVTYYLPDDVFYDYWTYELVKEPGAGANVTASNLTYTDIPVHIRGGSIIPHRVASANTTKALRKEDFMILVAPDHDSKATGRLYLDDGESLEQASTSEISFTFDNGKFSVSGDFGYGGKDAESVTVAKVVVLGQWKTPAMGTYDAGKKVATVEGPWKMDGEFSFQL